MKAEVLRIVVENGIMWIDGIKKRKIPGNIREAIEKHNKEKINNNSNFKGYYCKEMDNDFVLDGDL